MATLKWDPKDPEEVLDYSLKWDKELTRINDTIFDSLWRIEDGDGALTTTGNGVSGHIAYIWLSGGTDKVTYKLVNTITTDQGRTYERTVFLPVNHR